MPSIVFATTAIPAHTWNGLSFAAELVRRGHRVAWYCAGEFADAVAATGASPRGPRLARTPSRSLLSGMDNPFAVRRAFADFFLGDAAARQEDVRAILVAERADVLVTDNLCFGAGLAAESLGVPWLSFGDGPLMYPDADTPPFGSGLPRPQTATPAIQRRNKVVESVAERGLRGSARRWEALCRSLGVDTLSRRVLEGNQSPHAHAQASVPSFEYPRAALPPHVHYVGAIRPFRTRPWAEPDWWPRVTQARRPVVVVTQGTMRKNLRELVRPTVIGLRGEDVTVVAVTPDGGARNWGDAITAPFVPYEAILPHTDAFVTNGGYTGVTLALACGVPVVQVGVTEEKADIGARVAWTGAGLSFPVPAVTPGLVRRWVRRILSEPSFAQAAGRLQSEFDRYDSPTRVRELVEALAARSGTPGAERSR